MLPVTINYRQIAFRYVAIGEEFLWGSYYCEKANWGRKRSSKTADYRPRLDGKLTDWMDWGYWPGDETVYVKR
jgi:hypothetical protein